MINLLAILALAAGASGGVGTQNGAPTSPTPTSPTPTYPGHYVETGGIRTLGANLPDPTGQDPTRPIDYGSAMQPITAQYGGSNAYAPLAVQRTQAGSGFVYIYDRGSAPYLWSRDAGVFAYFHDVQEAVAYCNLYGLRYEITK